MGGDSQIQNITKFLAVINAVYIGKNNIKTPNKANMHRISNDSKWQGQYSSYH